MLPLPDEMHAAAVPVLYKSDLSRAFFFLGPRVKIEFFWICCLNIMHVVRAMQHISDPKAIPPYPCFINAALPVFEFSSTSLLMAALLSLFV